MYLAGNLDEADRWVQVPSDRVLLESFDLGHGHSGRAEMLERVLDQTAAQSLTLGGRADGQVMNPADACLRVALHRDVADHGPGPIVHCDGDVGTKRVNVLVDVARLAPAPVAPAIGPRRSSILWSMETPSNAAIVNSRTNARSSSLNGRIAMAMIQHGTRPTMTSKRGRRSVASQSEGCSLARDRAKIALRRPHCEDRLREPHKKSSAGKEASDRACGSLAVSIDTVLYSCPRCRARLEANVDQWDGWLRCPVCAAVDSARADGFS